MVANLGFLGLQLGLAFGGPPVDKVHGNFDQTQWEGGGGGSGPGLGLSLADKD